MSGADLIKARLPDELFEHVFRGVAAKRGLDSCALTRRRWRRAARVAVNGPDADEIVRGVAQRFPGLIDAMSKGLGEGKTIDHIGTVQL